MNFRQNSVKLFSSEFLIFFLFYFFILYFSLFLVENDFRHSMTGFVGNGSLIPVCLTFVYMSDFKINIFYFN